MPDVVLHALQVLPSYWGIDKEATVSAYYHTGCSKNNIQAAEKTTQGVALMSW